jgi:hypothetical protein
LAGLALPDVGEGLLEQGNAELIQEILVVLEDAVSVAHDEIDVAIAIEVTECGHRVRPRVDDGEGVALPETQHEGRGHGGPCVLVVKDVSGGINTGDEIEVAIAIDVAERRIRVGDSKQAV